MRIASFNLENLTGGPGPSPRHAVLRPQLRRLAADVLCLQEVDADHPEGGGPRTLAGLDALIAGTGLEHFHRTASLHPDTGAPADRHNLVILSRWPIRRARQLSHDIVAPLRHHPVTAVPLVGEMEVRWDRPILYAQIVPPGSAPLHVVNMHLKAPLATRISGQKIGPFAWASVGGWAEGYFLAAIKRSGQALEARLLVDQIFAAEPGALIAVCGDFNADAHEVPVRLLLGDAVDTGNGHLASQGLVALEHDLPEHRRFTVRHAGRKLMLDRILVSRPLLAAFRSVEVHNQGLGDEVEAQTVVEASPDSYHAPVVAEFALA